MICGRGRGEVGQSRVNGGALVCRAIPLAVGRLSAAVQSVHRCVRLMHTSNINRPSRQPLLYIVPFPSTYHTNTRTPTRWRQQQVQVPRDGNRS